MFTYLVIYKYFSILYNGKREIEMRGCYINALSIEDVKHEFRKYYAKSRVIDNIICQDSVIDVFDLSKLDKPKVAQIKSTKSMEKYGNCQFVERGLNEEQCQKRKNLKN